MTYPLNSYLEAVSNPEGRFRMLDGIFPLRGPDGQPRFTVRSHTADFETEWKGGRYLLRCFLRQNQGEMEDARRMSATLTAMHSRFLPQYLYMDAEMAVTGAAGATSACDVVLQSLPDGGPLHRFVLRCADRDDSLALCSLAARIAEMSAWLHENGMAHRNIKPSNIHLSATGEPVLLNYDFASTPERPGEDNPMIDEDNLPLAAITLGLCILSCDASLYRPLGQQELLTAGGARRIAPKLCCEHVRLHAPALYSLSDMVCRSEERLCNRGELDECLEKAAAEAAAAHPGILPDGLRPRAEKTRDTQAPGIKPGLYDLYRTVGELSENLLPVQNKQGGWLYADPATGRPADGNIYQYAEKFSEGRAVVTIGGYSAMIDKKGNLLIPPQYDEVLWDAVSGTAAVSIDGMWGLCARDGKALTGMDYGWMSRFSEDLLLARKGDKFGFLDRHGREAIPFVYDQASSFCNGAAPVERDGMQLSVDAAGNETEAEETALEALV